MSYGQHATPRSRGMLRTVLSWAGYVLLVVALVWGLQTFVVCPYTIPSGSMEDTIEIGDNVWSEKITYYFRDVEPGDIVTFADPEIPGRTLIKRAIATGGQTVDLIDGVVYVDGAPLDEPYTQGLPSAPLKTASGVEITYPYTVPEGEVWVMGDNRTNSADSRYFGSIDEASISGRAVAIYWPLDHIGVL